jgi:hypothetical protein
MNEPFQEVQTRYRRCEIVATRDKPGRNWYIRVTAPDGCYIYDGWWRDSEDKSSADAIEEAKRGAGLLPIPIPR